MSSMRFCRRLLRTAVRSRLLGQILSLIRVNTLSLPSVTARPHVGVVITRFPASRRPLLVSRLLSICGPLAGHLDRAVVSGSGTAEQTPWPLTRSMQVVTFATNER
ncbi:hypothetical protein AAHA92_33943 [Salvia divinorum]|uniref:Uncharacterized protein n=1 Tax=Salvia divinorum TaxID=28513 RepID=A0ABD1FHA7_SALDI